MSNDIVQVLAEDGVVNSDVPKLKKEQLIEMYRLMVLTRVFDEKGTKLQRSGKIGFYIGCRGQEASHIGSAYALDSKDWVFPSYREPGILFLRGIPVKTLVCQMIGNAEDPCQGRQMPCHFSHKEVNFVSISSPLATQIPQAVGASFASKYKGDKVVAITYFGDGSTSEGDFHVGMNFAGVYKTPTIFFCENNQWAISVPFHKQTASKSIAIKSQAYGIPGIKVDGNDILAVYKVTKEAVERARNGEGPTLIEAYTYRMGPHSSSDDDKRYRKENELEEWRKKDPITRFEKYLKDKKILSENDINNILEVSKNKVDNGVREAEKVGNPRLLSLFQNVYKDITPNLQEQMQELIDEQTRLGESENSSQAFPL